MAGKIEIDFSVVDADSLRTAIGGVVSQLDRAERHALGLKGAIESIRKLPPATAGGAAGSTSLQRQAMRDQAAMERLRERARLAADQAALRSTQRVESEKRKELARTDRQRAVFERQATRRAEQTARSEARAQQLAQRVVERQAAIDRRNTVANARYEARSDRRNNRNFGRAIDRERVRSLRATERSERSRERDGIRFGRTVVGGAMAPVRAVSGMAGSASRIVAGGLALGGVAGIYDIVKKTVNLEGQAGAIENLSNGKFTSGEIMNKANAAAKLTGIDSSDVMAGISAFAARTGDVETGLKNTGVFAKTARATDASVEDIALTASDLSTKFGIKNVEDMTNALGMLTQQGKDGSFELKDMAKQFPKIGAAAANYGLFGIEGVKQLGGFSQIARRGVGNSESASTSVEQFFNQLAKKNSKLEKGDFGRKFSIYNVSGDQTSGSKDLLTMIPELIDSVDGNMGSMIKVLDARGNRAVSTLLPIYNKAFKSATGTNEQRRAAAREAVRNEMVRTINVQGDSKMLERDFGRRMQKTDAKLGVTGETLKAEVGARLLPVLQEMIPKFAEMIPSLVDLTAKFAEAAPALIDFTSMLASVGLTAASWVAENPVKAALAAVAAGILKAVAMDALSSTLTKAIGGLVTGGAMSTGGIVAGGAATTGAGAVARSGIGLAGGVAGLVGAGIVAAAFTGEAMDYSDSEERKDDTPGAIRAGAVVDRYVSRFSGDDSRMGDLEKAKEEIASGGYLGKDSRKIAAAYLDAWKPEEMNSESLSGRLDETDRKKIVQVIERSQQAKKAFVSPNGGDAPLSDEQMMEFGFSPAESAAIRAQNNANSPQAQPATASDTLAEVSVNLAAATTSFKEAAEAQRSASQHLRDTLANKGVFR